MAVSVVAERSTVGVVWTRLVQVRLQPGPSDGRLRPVERSHVRYLFVLGLLLGGCPSSRFTTDVDRTAPQPIKLELVSFHRYPFGSSASSQEARFVVEGGAGAMESNAEVLVWARELGGTRRLVASISSDDTGAFGPCRLSMTDSSTIWVRPVDASGNSGPDQSVTRTIWTVQASSAPEEVGRRVLTSKHARQALWQSEFGLGETAVTSSSTPGLGISIDLSPGWSRLRPQVGPRALRQAASAYDARRGLGYLHGGLDQINVESDELWRFTGSTWQPVEVGSGGHEAQDNHAMSYDYHRDRLVLVTAAGQGVQRTWEWDARGWRRVGDGETGPAFGIAAMAYDFERRRVVLHGGWGENDGIPETWEWDGTRWTMASRLGPARYGHGMTYDPMRRAVVMVAGAVNGLQDGARSDAWSWDGQAWRQIESSTARPYPRLRTSLIYDSRRQVPLMISGLDLEDLARGGDTWALSDEGWVDVTKFNLPLLNRHMAFFHAALGKTVVFGGQIAATSGDIVSGDRYVSNRTYILAEEGWQNMTGSPIDEFLGAPAVATLEDMVLVFGGTRELPSRWVELAWTGNGWFDLALTSSVGPTTTDSAVAYDPGDRQVLLFGGRRPDETVSEELWVLDLENRRWIQKTRPGIPGRVASTLTSHLASGAIVLYGGKNSSNAVLPDTWVYSQGVWRRHEGPGPGYRYGHAAAYDPTREAVVVFGGSGVGAYTDTWEWDGDEWRSIEMSPECRPEPRVGHDMVYHPGLGGIVMHGGDFRQNVRADTWLYKDQCWSRIAQMEAPFGESGHALFFDPSSRRLVRFGGGQGDAASTWIFEEAMGSRPAVLFEVDLSGAGISAERIEAFEILSKAGALPWPGGEAGYIVELWDDARGGWRELGTSVSTSVNPRWESFAVDKPEGLIEAQWDGRVWLRILPRSVVDEPLGGVSLVVEELAFRASFGGPRAELLAPEELPPCGAPQP